MRSLLLSLGVASALDHIGSFNTDCQAQLNLFAGTPAQMAFTAGRIPFQFLNSLQKVIKARVSTVSGCQPFATQTSAAWPQDTDYSVLFGMDAINGLRILDANDTVLANAGSRFPAGCSNNSFDFNWYNIRQKFKRVFLPTTCRSANFPGTDCTARFEIIPDISVEVKIADRCTDATLPGFHLPQIELRCGGAKCSSLGVPCTQVSDCGSGTHSCDAIDGAMLDDTAEFLENIGLYRASDDAATCNTGPYTFPEQFFSKIVNQAANFFGFTTAVGTGQWHQLSFCDIGQFITTYFPTDSPTPSATLTCNDHITTLLPSQVCDGTSQCPGTGMEDEQSCNCGPGFFFNTYYGRCCPVCSGDNECSNNPWSRGSPNCGGSFVSSSGGPELCHGGDDGVVVCDPLKPSNGVTGAMPNPNLKSVKNSGSNQHIMVWSDCSGSFQIGNADEIAVAYGLHPLHQVATRLETIIKDVSSCRLDKNTDPKFFEKQFFLWGTTMFGGVFFDTLTATTPPNYNKSTPGAKLDDSFRWYSSADEKNYSIYPNPPYLVDPPFANVYNQWDSCNLASITSATRSCSVVADIASWFSGVSFPASWSTSTKLALYLASSCSDSFPTPFLECRGECDSGDATKPDSGCCVLRKAIVVPPAGSACPTGYKAQEINAQISDFALAHDIRNQSTDTTLVNFLRLLAKRKFDFDADVPLVAPANGADRTICLIDGDGFGDNVDTWANKTFTESCPKPFTPATATGARGCPQVLSTSFVKACGGTGQDPCAALPTATTCPATGCPSTNPACPDGTVCSPAALVAPSAFALAMLFALY